MCRNCTAGDVKVVDEVKQLVLGNNDRMEVVEKFCYLGDVIGKGGGADESSIARVRCAWGKFTDLKMLLTAREASLRVKGKIYRACAQRLLVYGSETWAMKKVDLQRLLRTENNMVRWMSGVTLKDRRTCEELKQGLGIESVDRVVSRGRLKWYGHVECKNADDWVYKCRDLEVVGGVRKVGDKKTWIDCVTTDMTKIGLKREDAQNRSLWSIKSNQMSLPNVRFAVKTTSVTPPSITGRYQCTTQADRDMGYREWFKTVPAIYHEINMNERMN